MEVKIKVINNIQYINIKNKAGLEVMFSNLGATIMSISYNNELMTMTPKEFSAFKNINVYYGQTIGFICGRIKDGLIDIDGTPFQFDKNEGDNTLHGGFYSLENQKFSIQRIKKPDEFIILYSFNKKKQKGTLPGKIDTYVAYTIKENEPVIELDFRLMSDEKTMVSLTNHTYFTLGEDGLDNLLLKFKSKSFVEPNKENLLPERKRDILPCLDFNNEKPVIKDIDDPYLMESKTKGYDHYFIFDKEKKIRLLSPRYVLEIETDFPGAQIYTDNYEDGVMMQNTERLDRRGIAIEPQDNPLERKVLSRFEQYQRHITYRFKKK